MSFCYVLRCKKDNSYYVGATKDIANRLRKHKEGKVRYTRLRLPIELVFLKEFPSYSEALKFEKRVKSWKKRKSIEKMLEKPDNISSKQLGVV